MTRWKRIGYEWHDPRPGPIFDWWYVWYYAKISFPVWFAYLLFIVVAIVNMWLDSR